jgi:hypothetical protein
MHVSASQIATWSKCARKWAYSRVRPRTSNRHADFGSRAHTHAEDWLREGKPPDASVPEGKCIIAGLGYLPMPKTAVVEHGFRKVFGGVTYVGRIDFIHGYDPGRIVVIGDHKTTGNLDYAMTEEQLVEDPQRIVYAHWGAEEFDVDYVAAQWVYYRRGTPKAQTTVVVGHRDSIAERFEEQHRRVVLPLVAATGVPPEEIPRNLEHCSAYGGCPYREECHKGIDTTAATATLLRNAS